MLPRFKAGRELYQSPYFPSSILGRAVSHNEASSVEKSPQCKNWEGPESWNWNETLKTVRTVHARERAEVQHTNESYWVGE